MINDLYIKSVLTVIAVSLPGILFRDTPIISTAHAEYSSGPIQVDIVAITGRPISRMAVGGLSPALPVTIEQ